MAGAAVFGPRGEGWGSSSAKPVGSGGQMGSGYPVGGQRCVGGCSAHPVAAAGDGMVLGEHVQRAEVWAALLTS